MSDFMITVGIMKVMFSTILFITALLIALNRSSVQQYFEKHISKKKVKDLHVAVVTDYILVLTFVLAASAMRLISGFSVFVGEYCELIEVRIVAIVSYLLDIICLGAFMYHISERITVHFADFVTIGLGTICGEFRSLCFRHFSFHSSNGILFSGLEFVIFLCMCIATTFSLHEFEFKAKWEELKRKRKVMKARKARKDNRTAKDAAAAAAPAPAAAGPSK